MLSIVLPRTLLVCPVFLCVPAGQRALNFNLNRARPLCYHRSPSTPRLAIGWSARPAEGEYSLQSGMHPLDRYQALRHLDPGSEQAACPTDPF